MTTLGNNGWIEVNGKKRRPSLDERLANYAVDINAGCHIWNGGFFSDGYGLIKVCGKMQRAHRVVYERFIGEIGEGLLVRHSCNNPKCINPRHLSLGTAQDNSLDMVMAGRSCRGIKHSKAIFTELDIRAIKDMLDKGLSVKEIATKLNKKANAVYDIKRKRTWRHIA